jgi:hypothetical protein
MTYKRKKKDNRGGKRAGAGAKPLNRRAKKMPISLFVHTGVVEDGGGRDAYREKLQKQENDKFNNIEGE